MTSLECISPSRASRRSSFPTSFIQVWSLLYILSLSLSRPSDRSLGPGTSLNDQQTSRYRIPLRLSFGMGSYRIAPVPTSSQLAGSENTASNFPPSRWHLLLTECTERIANKRPQELRDIGKIAGVRFVAFLIQFTTERTAIVSEARIGTFQPDKFIRVCPVHG